MTVFHVLSILFTLALCNDFKKRVNIEIEDTQCASIKCDEGYKCKNGICFDVERIKQVVIEDIKDIKDKKNLNHQKIDVTFSPQPTDPFFNEKLYEDTINKLLSAINNLNNIPQEILNKNPNLNEFTIDLFKAKLYEMITDYNKLSQDDKELINLIKKYGDSSTINNPIIESNRRRLSTASSTTFYDDYSCDYDWAQEGWKISDVSNIDFSTSNTLIGDLCNPIKSSYTEITYYGPFEDNKVHLTRDFKCPLYSSISTKWKVAHCGIDGQKESTTLFFNNEPIEKHQLESSISYNDNKLNELTGCIQWYTTTYTEGDNLDESLDVLSNHPFNLIYRIKTNDPEDYAFIYDIEITCNPHTLSPGEKEPTPGPITSGIISDNIYCLNGYTGTSDYNGEYYLDENIDGEPNYINNQFSYYKLDDNNNKDKYLYYVSDINRYVLGDVLGSNEGYIGQCGESNNVFTGCIIGGLEIIQSSEVILLTTDHCNPEGEATLIDGTNPTQNPTLTPTSRPTPKPVTLPAGYRGGKITTRINGQPWCLTEGYRYKYHECFNPICSGYPKSTDEWSEATEQCYGDWICANGNNVWHECDRTDSGMFAQKNLYWAPVWINGDADYNGYNEVYCINWIQGNLGGNDLVCHELIAEGTVACLGSDDDQGCRLSDSDVSRISGNERNAELALGYGVYMPFVDSNQNYNGKDLGWLTNVRFDSNGNPEEYCTLTYDDQISQGWGEFKVRGIQYENYFVYESQYFPGIQAKFDCQSDMNGIQNGAAVYFW